MLKMRLFIVTACISMLSFHHAANAQLTARSFGLAYSKNTKGSVTTFGNTVMNAVTLTGTPDLVSMNETSDANNGQGGLGFSQYGNDQSDMRQVDIDAVTFTHNSSSSDLTLPAGSNTILFARLYWGARIDSAAYSQGLDTLKRIRLRKGTTGNYTQFIAQDLDTIVSTDRTNLVYQAYVDITNFIQVNGAGTYMAADIPLTELDLTGGQYGGWAITVAYENPTLPYNSIRVYDGFAQVYNAGNAGTLAITLSGLNGPGTALASLDAAMGSVAWEGDASLSGDYIKINNVTVSNTLNPSSNFFNGSISKNSVFVTSKNPNYSNQMGIDIDELNVGTGYNIAANATSVNILFGTTADMYFPGVFTFVMKSREPTVKIIKNVTDANGNGFVDNNEILTYTLSGNNLGPDSSYNSYIIDTIPLNVSYVPGSLEVINAPGVSAGNKTDAPGDDQAFISTIGGRTIVRFNIGFGASATTGGIIPVLTGSEYLLRFKVKAPANASTVTNLGRVYGQSVTGVSFTDESTATMYLNTTLGLGESDTACNNYTWNGTTYTQSGTYTYSYINSSGNPVTDTLYLTVHYPTVSIADVSVCSNALPYSWNGNTYTQSGSYTMTGMTNANGCDSSAVLNLTVKSATSSMTDVEVCQNELPYSWNGQSYNAAGSYIVTLTNAAGCDSTAMLMLWIKQVSSSTTPVSICSNALPYAWNGQSYNVAGTYTATLTNAAGCDSLAILDLSVRAVTSSMTDLEICPSQLPYTWNGIVFTQASLQTATLVNAAGCDSLATLMLMLKPVTSSITPVTVCTGSLPYAWNGQSYNAAGTYTVTLVNSFGCDSITILDLSVNSNTSSMTHVELCPSELPYTWNGQTFNTDGTYLVTLTNAAGCDSLATLMLMLKPVSSSTTPVIVCSTDLPYSWNGQSYSAGGTYSVILTNVYGCDSTAYIELEVRQPSSSITPVTVCSNTLPYAWNGQSYNAAGSYTVLLTNDAGCDSVTVLDLTVNQPSSSTTPVTVCSNTLPYSWNGQSYNAAGSYTITLTNAAGCDSVTVLDLLVNQPTSSNTPISICSSGLPYSWNGQSYSAAGNYSVILVNAAGCDSVATLELSVRRPTSGLTTENICSSALPYSWNGQSYNAGGTYTVILVNADGCDSLDILDLQIRPVSSSMLDTAICERDLPFLWNGISYVQSATVSDTFTNAAGCDSIATLMLTVINCDPPCYTDNFNSTPAGWTLSQGARFFNYINPANNCTADKGIITPGVGGNNPAFIRTPLYTSSGARKLNISFDIFVFDANLKCNTWKNYDCPTSIDVYYVIGGVRYPGIIDFVLPPNGPGLSPAVNIEFSVGNSLPAGTQYAIEIAFKFWSGTGVCVQQNTKYVIDNFSVCEKQCAVCPVAALYSRAPVSVNNPSADVKPDATDLQDRIGIWPNPSAGMIWFSADGLRVEKVELADAMGRIIYMANNPASKRIDLSAYGDGYYFIRVSTDKGIAIRKIYLTR